MRKNKKYFENQIKGLLLIVEDESTSTLISRDYIKKKLQCILANGINFHPTIKDKLEKTK